MKRLFAFTLATLLFAGAIYAVLDSPAPSQTRSIPVNSTTAVTLSKSNTVASEAAGASTSDANTFTLGTAGAAAHATADSYNGLIVQFSGSGSCANNNGDTRIIRDDAGASDVLTLTPAADATVDPNCTYIVGPALPSAMRSFCIGNCTGTCYLSLRSTGTAGGTADTDRISLAGGQWYCIDNPRIDKIEVLSGSATDTLQTVWQ